MIARDSLSPLEGSLPWQMRRDLIVYQLGMRSDRREWGVKDPLMLRYYQLAEPEYWILNALDGQVTMAELQDRFERQFRPRTLARGELQGFLQHLYGQGLVTAATPGQADVLLARRDRTRRQVAFTSLTNLLAIRFRGVDPERFLAWLDRGTRWLFSPLAIVGCLLLMVAALALVIARGSQLGAELLDLSGGFGPRDLAWLAVALAGTKVLHELSHGLTCKHFGGECHEIGVMLLAFTPCLYCDVTDAWTLPRRWQRIAISAAGIWAECLVAAVAALLWSASEPGFLHTLCLNVMLVCSVSTIIFNGNPLLRYDGYYILSDLVAIPNLAQQATAALRAQLARWFFDLELADRASTRGPARYLLPTYAVAAAAYRCLVLGLFLWLMLHLLKPHHLELVAQALGLLVAALMLTPAVAMVRLATNPVNSQFIDWRRAWLRGGAVALLLSAALLVPLPYRVTVPAVIEARQARRVYVSAPGDLIEALPAGTKVAAGQAVARLENLDVQLEVQRLRGARNQQRLHLQNLKRRQVDDPEAAALVPAAVEAVADVDERLRQRLAEQERLVLKSPIDGTILPPHELHPPASPGTLPFWSGTPLDEQNRRCYLESGTLVCSVGDPNQIEAVLAIDQSEIGLVSTGQHVRLQIDDLPGIFLTGSIAQISEMDLRVAPRSLAAGGDLPSRLDPGGLAHPRSTTYQARVDLDPAGQRVLLGATGRAKIAVDARSLGWRLWRFLSRTFRLEL